MQTEKPNFINHLWICVICVYLSVLGGLLLNAVFLPQSQSRVIGETANLLFQSILPRYSEPSTDVLIIEINPTFTKQHNSFYDLERTWPPTYGAWADLVDATAELLRPRAIFLDVHFSSVRGTVCQDGTTGCDSEDWQTFLDSLCALGRKECREDDTQAPICPDPSLSTGAIPLVLGQFGSAATASQTDLPDLDKLTRLVASCGHLSFSPLSAPTRFSSSDSYGIEAYLADGSLAAKPAIALIKESCRSGNSPFNARDCDQMNARFETLAEYNAGYGVFWNAELDPLSAADTAEGLACAMATQLLHPMNLEDTACGSLPAIQAHYLREVYNNTEAGQLMPDPLLDRFVMIGAGREGRQDSFVSPLTQRISAGIFQHGTVLDMLATRGPNSPTTIPLFFGNAAPWMFELLVFPIVSIAILLGTTSVAAAVNARFFPAGPSKTLAGQLSARLSNGLVLSVAIAAIFWLILDLLLGWSFHEWAATSFFSTALFAIATLGEPE